MGSRSSMWVWSTVITLVGQEVDRWGTGPGRVWCKERGRRRTGWTTNGTRGSGTTTPVETGEPWALFSRKTTTNRGLDTRSGMDLLLLSM